ncbi:MAG: bifunctional 5,10-methylenetetrahydrofolate dehydrogenase/5,10-methenyltetrahydrofolate cyclohydrolase [bacterium]|nr:MAG: bifunctional 5,10-methylenetetrahydrofolate dehydrogenase/5,10-methenyltetrahydrofolate cyclohydrolase [bacterium]
MAIIFDGKTYALKKKELLKIGVNVLKEKGIIPQIATIIIGNDPASVLYVNLKKKFMEEIGCQLDIYRLNKNTSFKAIKLLIDSLNEDKNLHGIMIQLPLPLEVEDFKEELINLINEDKDVDGLKENSKYLHPTSKAVVEILSLAENELKTKVKTVCVVGSNGMVGKPLVKELKRLGITVAEVGRNTKNFESLVSNVDCVVSSTGVINIIGPEIVKENQIIIDVGAPFGDVSHLVSEKVSFITPVPGGVGPVTITCLAENLLLSAS